MSRSPAPRRALRAARAVLLALVAGACSSDAGPGTPATIAAADGVAALAGTVGAALPPLRVRVQDDRGRAVAGASVVWTATAGQVAPATGTTDRDGVATATWTLGARAEAQALTASVPGGGLRVQFAAVARADRPASVRLAGDTVLGLVTGASAALRASVADRYGNPVDTPVAWRSADPGVATVDGEGRVLARSAGSTTIEGTSDTARVRLTVRVSAPAGLAVTRVLPDTLRPGGTVTVEGTGFTRNGAVRLLVAGAPATLVEASDTRLRATIPALTALPCQPTAAGRVTVVRDASGIVDSMGVAAPLVVATRRPLAVGESWVAPSAADGRCALLEGGSRYLVSVLNTDRSGDRFVLAQLRGAPGSGTVASLTAAGPLAVPAAPRASRAPAPTAAQERQLAGERAHGERLEWERRFVRASPSPLAALRAARARGERGGVRVLGRARRPLGSRSAGDPAPAAGVAGGGAIAQTAPPAAGDTVALTVYNLSQRSCARAMPVRARVVYAGTRAVVYEDVRNALAGRMDAVYQQVGREFDDVMYPILRANVGDPLAMDRQLDRDGRVAMLFTRMINDSMPNVLGFVTSCNFFPRADAGTAASNEMELFYGRAPDDGQSAQDWRFNLRATIIHEVKHITSFATKIGAAGADGFPNYEDVWLEEATARLAEELYARSFSGARWRGNAGFAATVGCERTRCDDRPRAMAKIWEVLPFFYANVAELSPLAGANDGRNTFYASGWSIVRWALDHYGGSDEGALLKALTDEPRLTGLENLAARTGRSPDEMLADWSFAAYVGPSGFAPRRTQQTMPSWNWREMLAGMNASSGAQFPSPTPLAVRPVPFGEFLGETHLLRGWSGAFYEVAGRAGPQLLELRAPGGGAPAATARLAVLRVE